MKLLRIAADGLYTLAMHPLRSGLMTLGTVVGVAALIVVMALGAGTQRKLHQRLQNFGPDAIMIPAGGGKRPGPDMNTTTLTLADAEAIRSQVPDLALVSPMAWHYGMPLKHDDRQHQAFLWGVEPDWHQAFSWYPASGRGITAGDVAAQARVCVLGASVARELFGQADPIGRSLQANNVRLEVVGVLEERGASPMGGDWDDRLLVPITTAMRRILNVDHLGVIRVLVDDPAQLEAKSRAIRDLLRTRHRITPPQEDDFRIVSAAVIARFAGKQSGTLQLLLTVLAAVSLLVGGVVQMSVLLVAVSERTNEVGLRRAVGASEGDIFRQFLVESVAVALVGLVVGLVLGHALCLLLPRVLPMPLVPGWPPVLIAVAAALAVGLVFGLQPARRAARLDPVSALR
ncbi:MAG: ABC transporter permease [Planctomycetota bacterium]